jgi:hypothetical protein
VAGNAQLNPAGPARRRFLGGLLWTAGLSVLGALPSGCSSQWSLLPPRPVPWVMKPLSSAKTGQLALPDGRVWLQIGHELLRGVTPAMLAWWWRNIDGEMEIGGRKYHRYLIWHPIDHIHFELVKRLPDGSVGPGAVFHIVEALGADIENLVDVRLHLQKVDETGAVVAMRALAQTVLQIRAEFLPREGGTAVVSTMTIGSTGLLGGLGLNAWQIERFFPPETRQAWLKHSVEEIGNLQFFLPELYRQNVKPNA